MSALPAWKRALLEKKKQQEHQEELKKKQEQEAYIKSLPPWKRAIVLRDMEKGKTSATATGQATGNAPTSTSAQPTAAEDKWKAALSQSSKTLSTAEKSESPARSRVAWGGSGVRTLGGNQNKESGKPTWVREKSPKPGPSADHAANSTGEAASPRTVIRGEQRRGSVQLLKDQFKTDSPPPTTQENMPVTESTQSSKREVTPPGSQQLAKNDPSPQPTTTPAAPAAAPAVQVDDSDLAGLPSWKRALILKKRQKQAGIVPGANIQPQSGSTDKATTSTEPSKANEPSYTTPKSPDATKKAAAAKSRPDVVNRANESENPGSNKLVQKEGVSLHPPIFNEVGQWANVAADDPKFTQLPQWKQALILRRRKDIAKRSGQETSPPPSPTVKTAAGKRRASSPSSGSQADTKKGNKKATTKSTGKTEGKKTSSKTKATEDKKTTTTKSSNKVKAKSGVEQTAKTAKANAASNKAKTGGSTTGKYGSGGIKPVRSAPAKPPEKKQVEENKEEEKEEPMFTWNFSKSSMDTGDAMSNSSDSELEDVQITSIDDELSDEDDSGIGGSGGTILKSYKPLADTSDIQERSVTPERRERSVSPEKRERSVTPEKIEGSVTPEGKTAERSISNSTSDPTINKIPRSESKSILIDTAKKSYKVSKVSPSRSLLDQE